jgi:hypothetical protein
MEKPYKTTRMASGNLSLTISESTSWEAFPQEATAFLKEVRGFVLWRTDTPVERIWHVIIQFRPFWLSYDDYGGMSLDSIHSSCNSVLERIQRASVGI